MADGLLRTAASCCSLRRELSRGITARLAAVIPDGRDASRVTHRLPDILRARIFAIACGYKDADDLDRLRLDPAFKLACARLPDTGSDLCSQPTISRWGMLRHCATSSA
jgi:Transposase DDE domain group 1